MLLALAGFSMILNNASVNALLQSRVPDRLRGRVMSVYVFMFIGMTPLGALQAGALARWFGAPYALACGAGALLLILAWIVTNIPELRGGGVRRRQSRRPSRKQCESAGVRMSAGLGEPVGQHGGLKPGWNGDKPRLGSFLARRGFTCSGQPRPARGVALWRVKRRRTRGNTAPVVRRSYPLPLAGDGASLSERMRAPADAAPSREPGLKPGAGTAISPVLARGARKTGLHLLGSAKAGARCRLWRVKRSAHPRKRRRRLCDVYTLSRLRERVRA